MDKGVFFILFVIQESRLCLWAFNKIQILIFFSDKKLNGFPCYVCSWMAI